MKNRISIILFLFIVCTFLNAQPSGYTKISNSANLNEKFKEVAQATKTIRSDFTQTKTMKFISQPIISKGKFLFKRENNILWAYTNPFAYKIVITNGKMLIDDEGKKNEIDVDGNAVFKQINNIIVAALSGNIVSDESFSTEFYSSADLYCIEVTPKDESVKSVLKSIRLYINKTTYDVVSVELEEVSGNINKIEFFNRKTNVEISQTEFAL